jgi:hypothetical protein
MEYKVYKPFGPPILQAKIPEKIIEEINKHIDELILDKNRKEKQNYGYYLAGDVTEEFKLEQNFAKEIGWIDFLAKCSYEYINHATNQKITKFNVISTWVVRQFKNEFNPTHWHGGHISGAGFLKVPKNLGNFVQDKGDKQYKGGTLNLLHGTRQFLSQSIFQIKPQVGHFFLFPNYMMHTVYPFKGTDEERRSISFNAFIDEDIHNVYADYVKK